MDVKIYANASDVVIPQGSAAVVYFLAGDQDKLYIKFADGTVKEAALT